MTKRPKAGECCWPGGQKQAGAALQGTVEQLCRGIRWLLSGHRLQHDGGEPVAPTPPDPACPALPVLPPAAPSINPFPASWLDARPPRAPPPLTHGL